MTGHMSEPRRGRSRVRRTRADYANQISSLHITGDKSNGGKVAKAMMEAYYYLSGGAPHAGNNKNKTDYAANTAGNAYDDVVHAYSRQRIDRKTSTAYVKPGSGDCIKNYIIYISNGPAQDNSSDITTATNALGAAGGSTTAISLNPSGSQDNPADEWARFLKRSSVKGVVYTIDVDKGTYRPGPRLDRLVEEHGIAKRRPIFRRVQHGHGHPGCHQCDPFRRSSRSTACSPRSAFR